MFLHLFYSRKNETWKQKFLLVHNKSSFHQNVYSEMFNQISRFIVFEVLEFWGRRVEEEESSWIQRFLCPSSDWMLFLNRQWNHLKTTYRWALTDYFFVSFSYSACIIPVRTDLVPIIGVRSETPHGSVSLLVLLALQFASGRHCQTIQNAKHHTTIMYKQKLRFKQAPE